MKRLCILLLPLLFAGCSTDIDPEDQRFFNRGWLFPHRDIDKDPSFPDSGKPSPMPKQAHPEKYKEDPIVG
jgi:hypothetical protein